MATITTMAMLNAKCFTMNSPPISSKPTTSMKPNSLLTLPKTLASVPSPISATAMAGAFFSALSFSDSAFAAQQIADVADGDNRGLALLLPIIPALAWVLYNILQPALNQLNKMRNQKALAVGLGLGSALAGSGWLSAPEASAAEAAAASSDSRGLLLLLVVSPALAWVAYNILQPALNQINKMRS